jgi:hypothetical protein
MWANCASGGDWHFESLPWGFCCRPRWETPVFSNISGQHIRFQLIFIKWSE